jgi:hypothetical protein
MHDLQANAFFVALARASVRLSDQGPSQEDQDESDEAKPSDLKRLHRRRLTELPKADRSERTIAICVGQGRWWERRPGGGEVA